MQGRLGDFEIDIEKNCMTILTHKWSKQVQIGIVTIMRHKRNLSMIFGFLSEVEKWGIAPAQADRTRQIQSLNLTILVA